MDVGKMEKQIQSFTNIGDATQIFGDLEARAWNHTNYPEKHIVSCQKIIKIIQTLKE